MSDETQKQGLTQQNRWAGVRRLKTMDAKIQLIVVYSPTKCEYSVQNRSLMVGGNEIGSLCGFRFPIAIQ